MSSLAHEVLAPASPAGARTRLLARERRTGYLLLLPSAVLIVVFFLVPLGLTVTMSFYDWPIFGARRPVGLANYAEALGDGRFWDAVWFTTWYTALTSVLGFAAALGLALLLRPRFPGRTIARSIVFAPVTIGMGVAGLLWLTLVNGRSGVVIQILRTLGVLGPEQDWLGDGGAVIAIAVVLTIWKTVGLPMLVLIIGMDSIDESVYEAARIDGAGPWSTLTRITLPLINRPLALVVLLTVIANFLSFDQFYTLSRGGPDGATVSVVFYLYEQGFQAFRQGYAAAIAVLIALLLAILTVIQVRVQQRSADE